MRRVWGMIGLLVLLSVAVASAYVTTSTGSIKVDRAMCDEGVFATLRGMYSRWQITADETGTLFESLDGLTFDVDSGSTIIFSDPVVLDSAFTVQGAVGLTDTVTVLAADTMALDLIFINGMLVSAE